MSKSDDAVKLIATIGALKLLVGKLYTFTISSSKLTDEQIIEMHDEIFNNLPTQALMKTSDAAWSDLISSEIETELKEILRGAEAELGVARKTS
jgi:hypothetical protein